MNKLRTRRMKAIRVRGVALCRALIVSESEWRLAVLLGALLLIASNASAQTTAFTYQGKLVDNGSPANSTYDMQFKLFDNPNAGQGTQQGATITNPSVQVSAGIFTVQLDFGSAVFASGTFLYLEVSLRPAGNMGGYTSLAPRQQVTSTPYAVQSFNAMNATNAVNATNAAQLGGVAASQYVVTTDPRMSDARPPAAGGTNYIQNTTSPQAATNFNISGNGIIGGNLGLGTTASGAKLHINGAEEGIRIQGPAAGNANMAYLNFFDSAGTRIGFVGDGSASDKSVYLGAENGNVHLYTNTGAALTATATGKVGVGTTDPQYKLHVVGGSGALSTGVYSTSTDGTGVLGTSVNFSGIYGISTNGIGVRGESISSYGVYGYSNTTYAGYFIGNVYLTGSLTQASDARLKQGVSNLGYGLPEVLRLRPVTWRWKDRPDRGLQLGLVAQEVEMVLPELVTTAKDAEQTKGLNYIGVLPVLIKAIQEQQQQIEGLKKRQQEFDALKRVVCTDHPNAEVCKSN